jgi:hypothetical protein
MRSERHSDERSASANHVVLDLGIDLAAWVGAATRVTQIMRSGNKARWGKDESRTQF